MNNLFKPINTFLINLEFSRQPKMPDDISIDFKVEVRVVLDKWPDRFQVNMKFQTIDCLPLIIKMEAVGLFKYIGNDPEKDKMCVAEYLNNTGFLLMWSTFLPVVRSATALMVVNPPNIPLPLTFEIDRKDILEVDPPKESGE